MGTSLRHRTPRISGCTSRAMPGDHDVPVIVRGEGAWVYDDRGKRYLDGLAGLFVSQVGHGRTELAEADAKQASELAYFPVWSYAHPRAIELAERLADLAPGDLERVFFTTGGSEAVESAWKLARQYFQAIGTAPSLQGDEPLHRVPRHDDGRAVADGCARDQGAVRAARARRGQGAEHQPVPAARPSTRPRRSRLAIEMEGPETVAAVFLEPVQNSGGCFPPPPGYFQRVREICDEYGVLLVSDEVICAFGRLGHWFGSERYDYLPDIITMAKGMTSGYSPVGGMIARPYLVEPFLRDTHTFLHGITFGGHPVSCAVALANLDLIEREGLLQHVRANEDAFRGDARTAARPPDRRRRARRRLLLRDRAGEGQSHAQDVRPERGRAVAARVHLARAVRRGADLSDG